MNPHLIMFHHFHGGNTKEYGQGSLSAMDFESVLLFIGLDRILPAKEFLKRQKNNDLLPHHVALSFDDGLRGHYHIVWPILKKYNLTAFFFVYTCTFENRLEMLETYKFVQKMYYSTTDDFSKSFLESASTMIGERVTSALATRQCAEYLKQHVFYSDLDRYFRYIRDKVLSKEEFMQVLKELCGQNIDFRELLHGDKVWMTKDQIIELHSNENIIGIHTVDHLVNIDSVSKEKQYEQYSQCQKTLAEFLGEIPTTVSYPLGKYNEETLEIMDELSIEFAVTTNETLRGKRLEFPRRDHANIFSEMQQSVHGSYQYHLSMRSDENSKICMYNRDSHKLLKKAIQTEFGERHPIIIDRDLFDWQYKGGEYVVLSKNTTGMCGYALCKADDPILGVGHNCWQQMMWVVEPSADRFEIALQMLFAPTYFQRLLMTKNPSLNEQCSSFVVGINTKTALPIFEAVDEYQVVNIIPRWVKILSDSDFNDEHVSFTEIWEHPDPTELETFWKQIQVAPHVMTATHRDANYWNWRYVSSYKSISVRNYMFFRLKKEPLNDSGLIVAKLEHGALRFIEMLPPLWDPTSPKFQILLAGVISHAIHNGCKVADFWCTHKKIGECLSCHGWHNQFDGNTPADVKAIPMIFTQDGKGRHANPLNLAIASHGGKLQDQSCWYFVKSDGDMDRPKALTPPQIGEEKCPCPLDIIVLGSSNLDWISDCIRKELGPWGNWKTWSCDYGCRSIELALKSSTTNSQTPKWLILVDQPIDLLHRWDIESKELEEPFSIALTEYMVQIHNYVKRNVKTTVLVLKMMVNTHGVMASKNSQIVTLVDSFNTKMSELAKTSKNLHVIDPCRALTHNTDIFDIDMWVSGKYTFSMSFSHSLAFLFRQYITAGEGLSPRLIILDLDETMWGGILGEVGELNVNISEDYLMLHRFIRQLRTSSGMMIAIASKNDMEIVKSVFEKRFDETPLRLEEDFVVVKANWGSKAQNISQILAHVNLKPHQAVFVDDNMANLEEVSTVHSGIHIIQAKTPLQTLKDLKKCVGMISLTLSRSDYIRTKQVKSQIKVLEAKEHFKSATSFFGSLQSRVNFHLLCPKYFKRAQQLINKTNQFNLNAIRWRLEDLAKKEKCKIYAIEHSDKFSDKEVIGVVALQQLDGESNVCAWALSCRVLGKGVEIIVLKGILSILKDSGVRQANFQLKNTGRNNAFNDFIGGYCGSTPVIETNRSAEIAKFSHTLELPNVNESMPSFVEQDNGSTREHDIQHSDVSEKLVNDLWVIACEMSGQKFTSEIEKKFNKLSGWSSIVHMRFISQIKFKYGIDINYAEMTTTMKFSRLCHLVHLKIKA